MLFDFLSASRDRYSNRLRLNVNFEDFGVAIALLFTEGCKAIDATDHSLMRNNTHVRTEDASTFIEIKNSILMKNFFG